MGVITTMLLPLLSIALLTVTEVISQEENLSSLAGSETRIVGGTVVDPPHKYPFQVYFAAGNYACGGTILDPHHVLTAQHCLFDEEGNLHEPASCFMVVGVETFFMRPDYDPMTHANDIAILRLNSGLEMSSTVQPIMLPDSQTTMTNITTARVTGWGGVFSQDPDSLTNNNQRLS